MSKEKQEQLKRMQKQLKHMFDWYDDSKEKYEQANEYLNEFEDEDNDGWVQAQKEMETYWCRKDDVAEQIKTFISENVSQQDLLEVIRQNFVDYSWFLEHIPIPTERKSVN